MSGTIDTLVKVSTATGTEWRWLPAGTKRAPQGAQYEARWRTPGGATRSQRFPRKLDAQRHLDKVAGAKVAQQYVDATAGRQTFAAYSAGWLERKRQTVRLSTVQTFSAHLNKHLVPAFGDRTLGSITREEVKTFAGALTPGVQPTTARAIVFTLAAVRREAIDDGRIVRNPAERIRVGAKTERRVDPMHIANVSAKVPSLAEAMPERWRAAVYLMASTGLRLNECLGLTVDRVNFLRRTIRIDRQLVGDGFGPTKTRAGVRTIPVSTFVIDLLAAHLAKFPAGAEGLIFTTDTTRQSEAGRPISRARWAETYRRACESCEVEGRTRTHDLRHVAASSLIYSGLSVAAVQAVLGHASPSETLEVYTHLWPGDEDRTRAAIEQASASWPRADTA